MRSIRVLTLKAFRVDPESFGVDCERVMKNLRIGVVGVGHIGSNHARLYAEDPIGRVRRVYDVDPSGAAPSVENSARHGQIARRIY
jgi:hypothetical protein